jgi:hypothetical protein
MNDDAWYIDIHKRLLEGDPTAPAELAEGVLEALVKKLSLKYTSLPDTHLPAEAATDALIDYIKRPEQFDPTQRGLFGFLVMTAERDLQNALAKINRRQQKEIRLDFVEVGEEGGNTRDRTEQLDAAIDYEKVREKVYMLFDDPKDREVFKLMIEQEERSTEVFARVLGLEDLPKDQQRAEVRRHKDRILKHFQRNRESILGHE